MNCILTEKPERSTNTSVHYRVRVNNPKLFILLKQLFERCLNGEPVPTAWKTGILSVIHKKGNRKECQNYRGITVTSIFSRMYGRILKKFVEQEFTTLEIEEQAGFRTGRSTMDHIFSIRQLIEKRITFQQPLHLVFVDLEKAYDNVPWNKLWASLKQYKINNIIIQAIRNLYDKSYTKIKVRNKTSNGFNVTKGLRQGCPLSPVLFKIYLQNALSFWKRKCSQMGLLLSNETVYSLFADDQLLIAEDYEDIEYMTRKLVEEYEKWGLSINLKKINYTAIGTGSKDLILQERKGINL